MDTNLRNHAREVIALIRKFAAIRLSVTVCNLNCVKITQTALK